MNGKRHPDADCDNCPLNKPTSAFVPSYGPQGAELVIVGEAPGYNEAKKGVPFSGSSGQLLNAVLQEYDIDRKDAFLTNVVLCRPVGNATPTAVAIKACSGRLHKEIKATEPKAILALGATASSAVAGHRVKITQYRAGPPKHSDLYPNVSIIPTMHPAACLRTPDWFPYLAKDVGKIYGQTKVAKRTEPVSWKAYRKPENAVKVLDHLLQNYTHFVIDIETAYDKDADFVQANHFPVLCIGIGYAKNKVVVLGRPAINDSTVQFLLSQLLDTKVTAHNGKFDLSGLAHIKANTQLGFDTMLASYVLDERKGVHGLEYLSTELLGEAPYKNMVKT